MDSQLERIILYIENNKTEFINKLQNLVRCPSLTGEEKVGQVFIRNWMEELDLKIDEWEPDVKELFDKFGGMAQYPSSWKPELDLPLQFEDSATWKQLSESEYKDKLNYKNRPNLAGILSGSGGGRSVILNGHIDVVTVEPVSLWEHDPFGGEIDGDKMFGRGTSDMKGGVAAMLAAVQALINSGTKLKGNIIIESVVNEEHSGNGTLACIARGYKADAVIVPEATGIYNYARRSGGGVYWQIKIKGREVHTGSRWKNGLHNGISAIEKTPVIINSLLELEKNMNRKKPVFFLGIGKINGGTYATSTARECVMEGVLYFSPDAGISEEGIKNVKKMLRDCISAAGKNDPWLSENPPVLTFSHYDDAYENNNPEIINVIRKSARTVLKKDINEIESSATDSRHLGNREEGMPVVIYGPGDMGRGHSVDEYININEYVESIKVLAISLYEWCK